MSLEKKVTKAHKARTSGDKGLTGPVGIPGEKGPTGTSGVQGEKGIQGSPGPIR